MKVMAATTTPTKSTASQSREFLRLPAVTNSHKSVEVSRCLRVSRGLWVCEPCTICLMRLSMYVLSMRLSLVRPVDETEPLETGTSLNPLETSTSSVASDCTCPCLSHPTVHVLGH